MRNIRENGMPLAHENIETHDGSSYKTQAVRSFESILPFCALGKFDLTMIDGLFRENFEIGLSFEAARFEKRNDFVIVVRGDDQVEIGRVPRLELTDRVASNEDKPNTRLLQTVQAFKSYFKIDDATRISFIDT